MQAIAQKSQQPTLAPQSSQRTPAPQSHHPSRGRAGVNLSCVPAHAPAASTRDATFGLKEDGA